MPGAFRKLGRPKVWFRKRKMTITEYRTYEISRKSGFYFASALDGDDLLMRSVCMSIIRAAIDQLWEGLETGELPSWFHQWSKAPTPFIDLDAIAGLKEQRDDSTFNVSRRVREKVSAFMARAMIPQEASPSQVDPPSRPSLMIFTAILVATPLSVILKYDAGIDPAVIFTLAVSAIAVLFGKWPAIALSALSGLAYNLCVVPPIWTLDPPERFEIVYLILNIGISFVLPWLLSYKYEFLKKATRTASAVKQIELA